MEKTFFAVTLFLCWIQVHAQVVRVPVAAVYTRLRTYSQTHTDAFSFIANQAALPGLKSFSAGLYTERKFMQHELSLYQAAFAVPTTDGGLGLTAAYAGSTQYNESSISMAYARKLGKVHVGAQFNYYRMSAGIYGNAASVNIEGGAMFHINQRFTLGVHVYNPTGSVVGKNKVERLSSTYTLGFGFDASERFFLGADIEKVENNPVTINAGIHYTFLKSLFACAGISSGTSLFYFGTGFLLNGFRIDVTASVHPQLGETPGLLLLYNKTSGK